MNTGPTSTATPVAAKPKAMTATSATRAAVTARATRVTDERRHVEDGRLLEDR